MSVLAMVAAQQVTLPPGAHGDRQGFTTPNPTYVPEPRPTALADRPWEMAPHERLRMRTAAFRATRLYPGPVGELLSREILVWEEIGQRLGRDGLVTRLVDHILTTPTPA